LRRHRSRNAAVFKTGHGLCYATRVSFANCWCSYAEFIVTKKLRCTCR
jgi:hypothetical protein